MTRPVWEHGGARKLEAGAWGAQVQSGRGEGCASNAMGGGSTVAHQAEWQGLCWPCLPTLRAVPRPQATSPCPHGPGEAPSCPFYRQGDRGPRRGFKEKVHLPGSDLDLNPAV